LAARCGALEVALFAVAFTMRQMFVSLSTALSGVFVPRINTMIARGDPADKLLQLMSQVGRYQMILHLMLLGGFSILGRYFVTLWVGPGYESAYWLVIIMAGSVTGSLTQNSGIQIQQAKNLHKFRSTVYLTSCVAGLVLTWMLAPNLGANAGAIGYAFTMVTGTWLAMNWYYHYRIGLHMGLFWKQMLPIIISIGACTALFLGVTLTVFPVTSLVGFLIVGILFAAINGLILWFFVLNPLEKAQLRTLFSGFGKNASTVESN